MNNMNKANHKTQAASYTNYFGAQPRSSQDIPKLGFDFSNMGAAGMMPPTQTSSRQAIPDSKVGQ